MLVLDLEQCSLLLYTREWGEEEVGIGVGCQVRQVSDTEHLSSPAPGSLLQRHGLSFCPRRGMESRARNNARESGMAKDFGGG